MPCEQKQTQNPTKNHLKLNKILKCATKNIQTMNFNILKSKKRQKNAIRRGWHLEKVDTGMKSNFRFS